jgi:cytochrome c peroxidase
MLVACGTSPTGGSGNPVLPPVTAVTAVEQVTTLDLASLDDYTVALPAHYLTQQVTRLDNSGGNPVTDAGATLGRVLFHDTRLSINNAVSCASCHIRDEGFTDPDRLSTGFDGVALTGAHSMRLANARWYDGSGFFWDKRAATLEAQAIQPIQNEVEMGFDAAHGGLAALTTKLNGLGYYRELFAFVYGDSTVTVDGIQRAIAQYVRAMASFDSRWDRGHAQTFDPALPDNGRGLPVPTLTAEENRGRELFMQPRNQGGAGCAGCHVPPTFSLAANALGNGLDAGETTVFKSPSLKNVAVSGPYMHDGRFATLAQVVDFYATGVQAGPALDNRLRVQNGQPARLNNLSSADRAALVAFMATLTDTPLTGDARFASPFR